MVPIPGAVQIPVKPATVATNATAAGFVDCLDYDYCKITVFGPTHATNNRPAILTISSGTNTVASSQTDITALVGGGVGGFTIPASTTVVTSGYKVVFLVDLRGKDRYLGLEYTPGTVATHMMTCLAELFRGDEIPLTAAKAQVNGIFAE